MTILSANLNVIKALMIRDLMGRFGRNHLGFVWTFIEPMILCTGVMFIWSELREGAAVGISAAAFVYSGYMPLTLWRHMTGPLSRILKNSAGLRYHRPVSNIDILLARCTLEFLSTTMAAALIYFVLLCVGLMEVADDPGLVLAGWLLTAWYFGAQGLIISAVTEYWEPAEKFIGPSNYLQLPISGVFFMVNMMPHYAQELLLLNPSVSCFEMIRAGFFGSSITTYYYPMYVVAWSAAMTVTAAAAIYHVRDRIQVN